jgi:formamidopyrimidine-DNA glycosylase
LEKSFTLEKFRVNFKNKKGKMHQVLMEQKNIAGIGNIYSSEILWEAGIHPLKDISKLKEKDLKKLYQSIKKVLARALKAKGDSTSDYRRPSGEKGGYQKIQNAYQMTSTKCKKNDGGIIKRIKIGARSAFYCPKHQRL